MRRKIKETVRICFASVLLAGLLGISSVAQAGVGDPVANFSLAGLDGKIHSPAVYKGKVLVLFFLGHN